MLGLLEGIDTKYIILNEIGYGATCSVYKGYSIEDESKKLLAIKIFEEKAKNYFDKEILINKYLPSEYFIQIYKYGSGYIHQDTNNSEFIFSINNSLHKYNGKIYYIIEEFAENGELFNYVYKIKKGFSERISARIFKKIVQYVKILHDNRIAHCDIKPENIIVGNDFNIKLIDFGFSEILEKNDNFVYNYKGSDIYSSPEVKSRNMNGYDAIKNDIFSLGVLLFVITVRLFPFERTCYSDRKYRLIMHKKYNDFWSYYQQFEFSNEFQDLINHLICYDPSERFTIEEILDHQWIKMHENKNNKIMNYAIGNNENVIKDNDYDEEVAEELEKRKAIIDEEEN